MSPLARRAKWGLALALLLVAGLVAATVAALYPRYVAAKRRAERRERASQLLDIPNDGRRAELLAEYAEVPEAIVALVDHARSATAAFDNGELAKPWRHAVERWAVEPEPRDPRPLEHIETILREEKLPDSARFELLYLREEVADPTYAAARDLPATPWLAGSHAEVLAALRAIAPIDVADGLTLPREGRVEGCPAGALVQVLQGLHGRVRREGDRLVIREREVFESSMSMNLGEEATAEDLRRFGFDPAWPVPESWIRVEYSRPRETWWLLGRGYRSSEEIRHVHFSIGCDDDMDVRKFFRVAAALRGCAPPRRIAERVYEAAPPNAR